MSPRDGEELALRLGAGLSFAASLLRAQIEELDVHRPTRNETLIGHQQAEDDALLLACQHLVGSDLHDQFTCRVLGRRLGGLVGARAGEQDRTEDQASEERKLQQGTSDRSISASAASAASIRCAK